jgi:hypothetical protein
MATRRWLFIVPVLGGKPVSSGQSRVSSRRAGLYLHVLKAPNQNVLIGVQSYPQRSWKTYVSCLHERILEGGMGWHELLETRLWQPAKSPPHVQLPIALTIQEPESLERPGVEYVQ